MKKKKKTASLNRIMLPVSVFFTGACILIIEVAATRILSPFFGNTIFTFSGVISVILFALSVGYVVGGKLADKKPDVKWFYGIILAGGMSTIILALLMEYVLPVVGYSVSVVYGPVIMSIILFFVPAFLLAFLSPYAITLAHKFYPKDGLGFISGRMFFWSTLGSIIGSLSAGFILIPQFGVLQIIIGVGVALTVFGGVSLVLLTKSDFTKFIWVFIIAGTLIGGASIRDHQNVLLHKDGLYQKIVVTEVKENGRNVRIMYLDRGKHGASFSDSDDHVLEYSKYFNIHEAFGVKVEKALVIGGGAYTISKSLVDRDKNITVDVAEIEPELYDISKMYFGLRENKRLKNYVADGRRFLHDADKKYDYIFSDAYSSFFGLPDHLITEEFFSLAKSKMNNEGIFIANFIGEPVQQPNSLLLSEIKTFRSVYPNSYFISTKMTRPGEMQNIIAVGIKGGRRLSNIKLAPHWNGTFLDPNDFNYKDQLVFTDNYVPVESMTAQMLRRTVQ